MNPATNPTIMYFIRHGESQANADGVFAGGVIDSPLTQIGIAQAQAAARDIKNNVPEIRYIICSSMLRARQTAAFIADYANIPYDHIRYDRRLVEYRFAPQIIGKDKSPYAENPEAIADLEGLEDPAKFIARIIESLQETVAHWPSEKTLFVGHGGVERALNAHAQGLPPKAMFKMPRTENAELKKIII